MLKIHQALSCVKLFHPYCLWYVLLVKEGIIWAVSVKSVLLFLTYCVFPVQFFREGAEFGVGIFVAHTSPPVHPLGFKSGVVCVSVLR